jgi:hypothetical protein
MTLPDPIQTYFAARAPQDATAFAAAFAADAVVQDEGASHHGPDQIVAWWQAAKAKYCHKADPLDMVQAGGKFLVRARVSGDFPGSPAVLTFAFGLSGGSSGNPAGDRIHDLRIG